MVCELCNVPLPNEQSKLTHILGKKHQLALHRTHLSNLKEKCSVFISGMYDVPSKFIYKLIILQDFLIFSNMKN